MAADPALRFAVLGDAEGTRSWEWRVHVHRGEVYARPRHGQQHIRASLHRSGHCHVAFWEPGDTHGRRVAQFRVPGELAPGLVRVFSILVPHSATIFEVTDLLHTSASLIPSPGAGNAIEINLFIESKPVESGTWPGQTAMSTYLLGRLERDDDTYLTATWHATPDLGLGKRTAMLEDSLKRTFAGHAELRIPVEELAARLQKPGGMPIRVIAVSQGELDGEILHSFVEVAFRASFTPAAPTP